MTNVILNGYVGLDTAKILKKLGFNMICDACWSMYPHFKGEPLGNDEEYELRSEGRDNEITYEPYCECGINTNNAMWKNEDIWACPKIDTVVDWLYHTFDIYVNTKPYMSSVIQWVGEIYNISSVGTISVFKKYGYNDRYEALNYIIFIACEQLLELQK